MPVSEEHSLRFKNKKKKNTHFLSSAEEDTHQDLERKQADQQHSLSVERRTEDKAGHREERDSDESTE